MSLLERRDGERFDGFRVLVGRIRTGWATEIDERQIASVVDANMTVGAADGNVVVGGWRKAHGGDRGRTEDEYVVLATRFVATNEILGETFRLREFLNFYW